jgi:hypothetical protein
MQRFQNPEVVMIITGQDPRSHPASSDSGSVSRAVGNNEYLAIGVRNVCTHKTHVGRLQASPMHRATRHAALTRLIVWRFIHISVAVLCGVAVAVVGTWKGDGGLEREGKEETKRGMCVYTPRIKYIYR